MLSVESIRFGWEPLARTPLFENVSITVANTERLALTGMSGVGKTTLCRLMCALLKPQAGRVMLDNSPLTHPSSTVSMVFQQYNCFDWLTVIGNVRFGLRNSADQSRITKPEAEALVERVGLSEFMNAYPADLSGGMRQRVAIARALAIQPRVLILDEPFSALDIITKRHLGEMVMELQRGLHFAVVVTLHNIEDVSAFATRVVCLRGKPAAVSADITPVGIPFEDLKSQIEAAIALNAHTEPD